MISLNKLTESSTQECISLMRLASGYELVSSGRRFPSEPRAEWFEVSILGLHSRMSLGFENL